MARLPEVPTSVARAPMSAADTYLDLFGRGLRLRTDDDGRLIVSRGALLTDADRVAIRHHRDELLAIASYAATPSGPPSSGPASARIEHLIPSGCVGPRACQVLGACGRADCGSIPDISLSAKQREAA